MPKSKSTWNLWIKLRSDEQVGSSTMEHLVGTMQCISESGSLLSTLARKRAVVHLPYIFYFKNAAGGGQYLSASVQITRYAHGRVRKQAAV